MDKYEEIKQIIEDADEDDVDFAPFGEGESDENIESAEKRLGMKLPKSYKWWLKNYGGGEIYGDEIFSLYEEDDPMPNGDIVHMYELNQKNGAFPPNIVEICSAYDGDSVFYFDKNEKRDDGELSVYEYYSGERYADDFIEFLKKQILEE
ncbi:MAG: SMI1/KNR4 family protein [Firmicutes bacterium]|nr:SMI1/KNR4 family protein [Bacillota bacterium]